MHWLLFATFFLQNRLSRRCDVDPAVALIVGAAAAEAIVTAAAVRPTTSAVAYLRPKCTALIMTCPAPAVSAPATGPLVGTVHAGTAATKPSVGALFPPIVVHLASRAATEKALGWDCPAHSIIGVSFVSCAGEPSTAFGAVLLTRPARLAACVRPFPALQCQPTVLADSCCSIRPTAAAASRDQERGPAVITVADERATPAPTGTHIATALLPNENEEHRTGLESKVGIHHCTEASAVSRSAATLCAGCLDPVHPRCWYSPQLPTELIQCNLLLQKRAVVTRGGRRPVPSGCTQVRQPQAFGRKVRTRQTKRTPSNDFLIPREVLR